MRVYLPATTATLGGLHRAGAVPAGPAHAVTPALRESYATGDTDELEYAALLAAATDSLRLLAADPGALPRRVVLAADVEDTGAPVDPAAGPASAVRLTEPLSLTAVASVHLDGDDAAADVAAAVAALPAADAGDDDAAFTVSGPEGHELLWYDVTEIPTLVADR